MHLEIGVPVILVAEDEPGTQKLLFKFLEKIGYPAQGVNNGRECVESLKNWIPELLILDIMMPEMNGIEVLRYIRSEEQLKDIKVIMLTARGEKEVVREALRLDADDFILKPLNIEFVTPRVRLHMYQPDVGSVRELLKTARLRDDSLFTQTGFKDLSRDSYELYPVRTPDDLQICLRTPRFSLPDAIARGDDFEILNSVVLYAKGVKWKRIWPKVKQTKIVVDSGASSDDDFTAIIEQFS